MSTGIERIAAAFAATDGRAALMPYLMGGFPDLDASLAIGEAYADGGADLVELGVPFSDPLADGPVIHAAGTRGARVGRDRAGRARARARARRARPGRARCATRTSSWPAASSVSPTSWRDADVSGLIVPDLPLEESSAALEACDAAGLALVPLVAPTTPDERLARIGAQARGFLYAVSVTGTTGERSALDAGELLGRVPGARRPSRWRSASASPRPSRPRPRRPRAPTASSSAPAWCGLRPRATIRPARSWRELV